MSLRIRWNIMGRGEWGFPEQYKCYFSYEGKGDGGRDLGSGLFLWARHNSRMEVGILNRGHRARLKKKMGLGLLIRRSGCGVARPSEEMDLIN